MARTRPIKNDEIWRMYSMFKGVKAPRNRMLFIFELATGFRIGEALSLNVEDVYDKKWRVRDSVTVRAENMKGRMGSKKPRTTWISKRCREELEKYAVYLRRGYCRRDWPLFHGRTQKSRMSRHCAWRIMRDAAELAGIGGTIANHGLRKGYGTAIHGDLCRRQAAGENVDPWLMTATMLGHRDPKNTMLYLDRNQELMRELAESTL